MTETLWPKLDAIQSLTPHQREQVAKAIAGPLGILGGPPGCGKTFCAAAVIRSIVEANGQSSVAVAGPTGKSAVRITESMNRYGLNIEATTVHRLLGVTRSGHDQKGWGFRHNAGNLLPYRFIVLTEGSMFDADLLASFFSAVEIGTHILIEGDTGQLPPVGHGAPLRDMIAAKVPCGELTEIKRNAGDIVRTCKAIREGRPWQPSPRVDVANGMNLLHCESAKSAGSIKKLQGMLANVPQGIHPIWDVQVLCCVNEKSELSRKALNKLLQDQLNPGGEKRGNNPFRLHDKVICTTNTMLDLVDEGAAGTNGKPNPKEYAREGLREFVANGEIGRVVRVEEKLFHVRFDSPRRTVVVPLGGKKSAARGDDEHQGAACDFDLGYAITVHKSQGSQWRIVIYMVDDYPGARMVCCRELVYTAISRAEELAVTIGRKVTMDQDCRRVALTKRKTFLRELLTA